MRVALYARVSTRDKDQDPENQLQLLRREAARAGDSIVAEYVDQESGGKANRKGFLSLMREAKKRRFDLVRVFALDRFSSEGIEAVFEYTAELDQCGVSFWSYCEPMLNTTGPMAPLYKAIVAWAAGYRNQRHSENVRLGLDRKKRESEAKGETYQHGRRGADPQLVAKLHQLQHDNPTWGAIKLSQASGLSVGSVHKYRLKAEEVKIEQKDVEKG